MDTQELPLVVFTLLAQLCVGAFVVVGGLHVLAGRHGNDEQVRRLSDPALYAIGPLAVVGLVVSLAHLGDPLHALYTCENFGRSWLSREIVFGVAFAVLSIAFSLAHARRLLDQRVRAVLAAVTALFGIAFIFSQAMIYLIPTIPGWNSWATPVGFFVTTFLLGSLGVGAVLVVLSTVPRLQARHAAEAGSLRQALRAVSFLALAMLAVELVVQPTYALQLSRAGGVASQAANLLLYGGGSVFVVEMTLVALAAGLLAMLLYQFGSKGTPALATTGASAGGSAVALDRRERLVLYGLGAAFVLVLAAEVLGRLLFYTSNVHIGI